MTLTTLRLNQIRGEARGIVRIFPCKMLKKESPVEQGDFGADTNDRIGTCATSGFPSARTQPPLHPEPSLRLNSRRNKFPKG